MGTKVCPPKLPEALSPALPLLPALSPQYALLLPPVPLLLPLALLPSLLPATPPVLPALLLPPLSVLLPSVPPPFELLV